MLKRISANGDTTKFSYDVLGRRTSMAFPARPAVPSGSILGDSVSYSYDVMGNLLTARNIQTEIRRQYYADGSLRSKVTVDVTLSTVLDSSHYVYDAAGRLDETIYDGYDHIDYTYGSTGDLSSIVANLQVYDSTLNRSFSFYWDELGRRKQIYYQGGSMSVTYAYDRTGILRKVYSTNSGSTNDNHFKFTIRNEEVDPVGHILKQTYVCPGWSGPVPGACGGTGARDIINRYNRLGILVTQAYEQIGSYTDSMRYDASGNLIRHYHGAGAYPGWQEFTVPSGSNRMTADDLSQVTAGLYVTHLYDSAGARVEEVPSIGGAANAPLKHNYHYDALGRLNGMTYYTWFNGNYDQHGGPNRCHYDADGQLFLPCDDDAGKTTYEGPNTATVQAGVGKWRFIQAPGLDNPLMSILRYGAELVMYNMPICFVTDGGGRQYAAARLDGSLNENETTGYYGYWRFGGGTSNSQGFEPDRFDISHSAVSVFRNRAYDSQTGRWMQEDPLGLSGGIDQYQFAGNNPVSLTDPFGLKVCFPGTRQEREDAVRTTEKATNTAITLDSNNCVQSFTARPGKGFEDIQERFRKLVEKDETYDVIVRYTGEGSYFDPDTKTAYIDIGNVATVYRSCPHNGLEFFEPGAIVTHELLGHGSEGWFRRTFRGLLRRSNQRRANKIENEYHRAVGQPERCEDDY